MLFLLTLTVNWPLHILTILQRYIISSLSLFSISLLSSLLNARSIVHFRLIINEIFTIHGIVIFANYNKYNILYCILTLLTITFSIYILVFLLVYRDKQSNLKRLFCFAKVCLQVIRFSNNKSTVIIKKAIIFPI